MWLLSIDLQVVGAALLLRGMCSRLWPDERSYGWKCLVLGSKSRENVVYGRKPEQEMMC